jgi:hypothetical protein
VEFLIRCPKEIQEKSKGNAEVNATFKGDGNVCKSDPE